MDLSFNPPVDAYSPIEVNGPLEFDSPCQKSEPLGFDSTVRGLFTTGPHGVLRAPIANPEILVRKVGGPSSIA